MIVIDVGNTNIVIGIYLDKKIDKVNRFNTKDNNISQSLKNLFNHRNISKYNLDYKICIISSVVPSIDKKIIFFFRSLNFKVLNVKISNIPQNIKFHYKSGQLGSDRIANTYSAIKKYGNNSIVIDFGTATTFDVIKNNYHNLISIYTKSLMFIGEKITVKMDNNSSISGIFKKINIDGSLQIENDNRISNLYNGTIQI